MIICAVYALEVRTKARVGAGIFIFEGFEFADALYGRRIGVIICGGYALEVRTKAKVGGGIFIFEVYEFADVLYGRSFTVGTHICGWGRGRGVGVGCPRIAAVRALIRKLEFHALSFPTSRGPSCCNFVVVHIIFTQYLTPPALRRKIAGKVLWIH